MPDLKGTAVNSLFTMIAEREVDARATVEELRARIATLTEQLTAA